MRKYKYILELILMMRNPIKCLVNWKMKLPILNVGQNNNKKL